MLIKSNQAMTGANLHLDTNLNRNYLIDNYCASVDDNPNFMIV